ncbi:hypothetical protein [Aestuariispira insulae]|uniref:Uncharacterized protein n=1 Tax=Aestuariispira insulae TaxID=1461337 RepID=A0A3D9HWY8_9PROT|nr:hypothetical protein [Aestuariispira insulae]RED54023.1 hypothetical protein DFP90_101824 [Aestuariispira insulae]
MNDQYDLFCLTKLREAAAGSRQLMDDIACGCLGYLSEQGYGAIPGGIDRPFLETVPAREG